MRDFNNFIPTSLKSDLKPLNLPDCIYLTEHCRCRILRVRECMGNACSFCRSQSKAMDSKRKWNKRMNDMDQQQQLHIAATYFGGKMPWKER